MNHCLAEISPTTSRLEAALGALLLYPGDTRQPHYPWPGSISGISVTLSQLCSHRCLRQHLKFVPACTFALSGSNKGHDTVNLQYSCGLVGCHLRRKVFEFAVSHEPHKPEVRFLIPWFGAPTPGHP